MLQNPKILSIGTAFPPHPYTQDEIWQALQYGKSHLKRIFDASQIEKRHLWLDIHRASQMSWQDLTEAYRSGAEILSRQAIVDCLDGNVMPNDLGHIVFVSCTGGFESPSVILSAMGQYPPDVRITHIGASGCGGGFPGLQCAVDSVKATARPALVVATELCSCTFYPEHGQPDPENDYEVLRANSLFGDASVAALVGHDDDWHHPTVVDSENYFNPAYLNDLGFVWRNGRLRVLLSRRVKDLAAAVSAVPVRILLERNTLTLADTTWFVVHAAGSIVLDNIRDQLGIGEDQMGLSREILRHYGNCSSATIGLIGKRLMKENIHQGDYALVVGVGPGMMGGCVLLRFI